MYTSLRFHNQFIAATPKVWIMHVSFPLLNVCVSYSGSCPLQIAEITEIKEQVKGSDYKLDVVWFYRPEEVVGGRKVRYKNNSDSH